MLGRAFCLAAMIKCGKGTETEHLLILVELFKILKSKDYLRQECIHWSNFTENNSILLNTTLLKKVLGIFNNEYVTKLTVDMIIELLKTSPFAKTDKFKDTLNDNIISIGADMSKDPDLSQGSK